MLTDSEIIAKSPFDTRVHPLHSKYKRLIARAREVPAATTVVAHPCDESSLRGVVEAAESGIIIPVLVGPEAKISAVAKEHKLDVSRFQIVNLLQIARHTMRCCRELRTMARGRTRLPTER